MKLLLKNRLNYYLISVFCLLIPLSSVASHVAGLDLTYKHKGGNKYEFTIVLYRDCAGSQAEPVSMPLQIYNATGLVNTIQIPKCGSSVILSTACNGLTTNCAGGTVKGIIKWTYCKEIDLGSQRSDWEFLTEEYARNHAVTNLINPGGNYCTVYATLDNSIGPNNSPTFSNDPFSIICTEQSFVYNHGVSEIDGDQLSYSFVNPRTQGGANMGYKLNYGLNSTDLLGLNSTTTLSPNGAISMYAKDQGVVVVAMEIAETKNGKIVGRVVRDMQFWIQACSNKLPYLTGINNTNNLSATATVGQQLCFDIYSQEDDAGQNVTMTWNNGIAGATFTQTPGATPIGHFCWTPTSSDMGSHTFTVTVQDDACPLNGIQIETFTIIVNANNPCIPPKCPNGINFAYSPILSGSMVPINQAINFTNTSSCVGAATYLWEFKNVATGAITNYTTQNPSHTFNALGHYIVKLSITIAGCTTTGLKIIRVGEQIPCENCIGSFAPEAGTYVLSAWVKENNAAPTKLTYTFPQILVYFPTSPTNMGAIAYTCKPSGAIIDGWQRVETEIVIPASAKYINLQLNCTQGNCFFDDVRIFPKDGSMSSFVYDPVNLRLMAELDERNYASLYEYDEEGKLIRVKKETEKGIMTIKENKNSNKKQ